MGPMYCLRILMIAAVLAAPASALALTAGDVTITNVNVGQSGTNTGTISREAINETLASFDTSSCVGVTITTATALPVTLTSGSPTLGFTARFTPPARGAYTCTVTMRDAGAANIGTFDVTSRGVAAELTVSTNALSFGEVRLTGGTGIRTFVVSNTGDAGKTLSVTGIAASGGEATDFTATPATFTLGAGLTRTITATFDPTANGTRASSLVVSSDDPVAATEMIAVNGVAVNPVIATLDDPTAFGAVLPGSMLAKNVTVSNSGTGTLTVTSAAISGGASSWFSFAGMPQATCNSGTSCDFVPDLAIAATPVEVAIRCAPPTGATGSQTQTLTFASDTAAGGDNSVTLTCTTGLTSSVTSFDFGPVRVGDSPTRTFVLTNSWPVTVSNLTATFSAQATVKGYSIDAATLPASLAAGATATVTVRFTPIDTTSGTLQSVKIVGTFGAAQPTMTQDMALNGDGLTSGYAFDPPALDIGAVRWDLTRDATITINNPYEATVRLTSAVIAPVSPTVTGEIARVDAMTFPRDLAPNGSITLTLRANPNNRLGAMAATLIVNSDLGATAMPTRTAAITATSTTPMITADPPTMSYDFGPTDVDTGPVTKDLKLTNSGDAILDVTGAAISGTGSPYTVVAVTPASVPPNTAFTATVKYDPSVVRGDAGNLAIGVAGIFGGSMTANFMLQGRGIDRTFSITEPGLFPETFRNPGSKAPVKDVVVRNTGEAPLNIRAVMVTGEPVWSLVGNPTAIIPGKGTAIFQVKFAPTTGGKAPTGSLVISHDDDTSGNRAIVMLEGYGKNPMLSVTPSTVISLGTTAVGFPVRLSDTFPDQLTVQNNDSQTFHVRELRLRGPSGDAFALTDDLSGQDLAPAELRRFDIVFSATSVGEFTAQLEIYLDEDTEPAMVAQLSGTAVQVDVSGGGGCQTGSGGGGAFIALMLAVLAVRKRRGCAALGLALLAITATASDAQPSRNIDLFTFRPAPSTTGNLLQVEAPSVGANGAWQLELAISHAINPLQVTTNMGETSNLVSQRTVFDFGAAFAVANRLELGARIAMLNQGGDQSEISGLEPAVGSALGDALAHAKVKVIGGKSVGVSVAANVSLPTATGNEFAGPGKVGASGLMLLGATGTRLSASANLGFGYQPKILLGNITQGNRALFGAGAVLRATDNVWISAEIFGAIAIGQRQRQAASPVEGLVGLRYQLTRAVGVALGLGAGLVRGVGAPAMQGVVAFELSPSAPALDPIHPPAPYVPPPDRDGDGIVDADDACAEQAEDKDGFGDSDGCPDPDNDFDSVLDGDDKCPSQREDKDGIADGDGCPDVDDDGDNIPEPADRCPKEMEDKDGFQDEDGCPDPDDDHDGVADTADKCPREPESINGNSDDDGCPDSGESLVLMNNDRMDVLEPIAFVAQTAKLGPSATGVLSQVAATLRAHPEISRLRIGVHVNRRGARDQELTDKRAAVLREWLVNWGIAAQRLDIRGFGSAKMIVKAQRKNAATVNDRVEFTIMQRK
jgi:outer membrane protein OmpA-like peptidoglycan-associated protein